MDRLFPLPIYSFLKIAYGNGGISTNGLLKIPGWLLKTILFEPLRWAELAIYNRKISQHIIAKPPVFILGFYRSGTSYLHEFFTQDDRFGYHSNFQMMFPEIMLSSERWMSPAFDSIFRLFKLEDPVHRVPLSLRFPGEEDGAMTTSLSPRGAVWGYFFPNKMIDYFNKYVLFENISVSEIEAWKQEYVFLLKKISLANHNKQLVLKSPPNTARIKLLLSLFPNARFVFIHRNPYEVYASNKKFWKVTHKIYALGKTRSVDINSIILDTYAKTMNQYLHEKHLVPQSQLTELAYDDFIKSPVTSIKAVYKTLKLIDFNYCEDKMISFAAHQKEFKPIEHRLAPEELSMVSKKLEPLIKHWNYSLL